LQESFSQKPYPLSFIFASLKHLNFGTYIQIFALLDFGCCPIVGCTNDLVVFSQQAAGFSAFYNSDSCRIKVFGLYADRDFSVVTDDKIQGHRG
jgi:hypothetical protein